MTAPLLSVDRLTVSHGDLIALDDVSLSVAAGEIVAVLGTNGAGKSSLMAAIMGQVTPRNGRVLWRGLDLASVPVRRRPTLGIGYCPEGRRLFPGLSVIETLAVAHAGTAADRARRIEAMLDLFPPLAERRTARAWSLSGGQQQMLAIARALMPEPALLLLDEPFQGLAPTVIEDLGGMLARITGAATAVLLADQEPGRALAMADTVLVLRRGRAVLSDTVDALHLDRIAAAVLGAGHPQ